MTISPEKLGVFDVSAEKPLPDGFVNAKIYKECCNILWDLVLAQAADAHPGWKRVENGVHKRLGNTAPETPEALASWFEKSHPQRVEKLAETVRRAVHVKHGLKPPQAH